MELKSTRITVLEQKQAMHKRLFSYDVNKAKQIIYIICLYQWKDERTEEELQTLINLNWGPSMTLNSWPIKSRYR